MGLMISTFISVGTPCHECTIALETAEDKPVVVDFGDGENVYHEKCLSSEVREQIAINQQLMAAGF
jgi:hypothetical protein